MRVVFVTHNDLGLACLEELVDLGAEVAAIFTRPKGKDIADQVDLDEFSDRHSIPLHRVESVNGVAVERQLTEYRPELLFVVGWSRLVDAEVLEVPSVAALGMHPAPLPRGRGRAPIAWSLIKGLNETALSFFHLVEAADAGDLVGQETIPIDNQDNVSTLYRKVVTAGRTLIRRHYPAFKTGEIPRTPQDDSEATWWPKRDPHHGLIDWTESPKSVYDWIRGQTRPYPGAFSFLDGQKIIIWDANPPENGRRFVRPGEIAYQDGRVLGVGACEGIVELTEIQVEEQSIPAGQLVTENRHEIGDTFENARDLLK
jgi:methionyl-tRNA formyltransferase